MRGNEPRDTDVVKVDKFSDRPDHLWDMYKVKRTVKKVKPMPVDTPIFNDKIRFVCVSDTHNRTKNYDTPIPDGDVLLHSGDFTQWGKFMEVIQFNIFLGSLPHKHKIVIGGNHDLCLDKNLEERGHFGDPDLLRMYHAEEPKDLLKNCCYLEDSYVMLGGYKIYGSPWTPEFYSMGFNYPRGQKALEIWNRIPDDADIVMTHGPPLGYGDKTTSNHHVGCAELLNTIQKRVKPRYIISGHIHESNGEYTDDTTSFINAAICDRRYRPSQSPHIFDLPLQPGVEKSEVLNLTLQPVSCLPDSMDELALEPITAGIAAATAIGGSIFLARFESLKCNFVECCDSNWIRFNSTVLSHSLSDRLYGQHLVNFSVLAAVKAHVNNPNPRKALVLSFHGWTGGGKNYVSRMVAESLFRKGMDSEYVRNFISTLHFPHKSQVAIYQDQLREWIKGNVSACGRALFIFDEMDKMYPEVINSIKPYLDYYTHINGVNYRRAIFIFLSNAGAEEINTRVIDAWRKGRPREEIRYEDLESSLTLHVYNAPGGLKGSEFISKNLVNVFVPFLPLERRHVSKCIEDDLRSKKIPVTDSLVKKVSEQLHYFPNDVKVFSKSGCKRVPEKVDLMMELMSELNDNN